MAGNEVGLQLMPLTKKQHIDFVQCTFARADTWALWQDSFPEDKPLESLLDILKLGFRGYRHLAEFAPSSVKLIFRSLTSLVSGSCRSFLVVLSGMRRSRRTRLWLNNDDNAMKTKLSRLCAVAMGMSALPATMANAEPDNAAATPAPTVPVVAQATDPVITAAPGQTENVIPNQPTEGNTLPAENPVIGQVMPGVRGRMRPLSRKMPRHATSS